MVVGAAPGVEAAAPAEVAAAEAEAVAAAVAAPPRAPAAVRGCALAEVMAPEAAAGWARWSPLLEWFRSAEREHRYARCISTGRPKGSRRRRRRRSSAAAAPRRWVSVPAMPPAW